MKFKLLLFLQLAVCCQLFAQTKTYFQQEVNYKIDVSLDDKTHTLNGTIEMEYTNNAPEALNEIYIHLWGNAFKNPSTAFCKQKLRTGSTAFYFAKDSDLGYFSSLDFTIDNEKTAWNFDAENPDIALLKLAKPLQSKARITIKTPFTLKIPDSFSRLGHVGESYQMTQWYPKPAVYDHKGWHQMPYLDMGEFYSEFGSFDVSITLPENYVVGATGTLQTESERLFLQKKVAETEERMKTGFSTDETFPPSSEKMKTIRYTAEKVHDFAWFADKRFNVQKGQVKLASGRTVDTWTMFTNKQTELWKKSIDYVGRAVEFYSEKIGEYPWPHATAVHSALSAGAGMEYPMITVIGNASGPKDLDQVITHEVGHNWFYGIFGTNERDHAWMDEGMNSYYEYRYITRYYGDRVAQRLPGFFTKGTATDLYETVYLLQARRRLDQAPETTSNAFTSINYGIGAYMKPGSAFGHLEQYLGTEKMDAIMHSYFQKWMFKHPYPEDLRSHFEQESGVGSGWFFDGYIGSNRRMDYALEKIDDSGDEYKILVKNRGEIAAPFPVSGMKDGEAVATEWFEGFTGEQEVAFPKGDYDLLILDAKHVTLDVFRKNNNLKTGGLFPKMEPVQLKFFAGLENSKRNTLYWLPIGGINKYDGLMPGLAVYNSLVPAKKFEFALATMYGLHSKDLNGLASVKYNIFPKSEKVKRISFGLTSKAFNYRSPDSLRTETGFAGTHLQYRRLVPYVRMDLMRSPVSNFYQTIQLRSIWLEEQMTRFKSDSTGAFYQGNEWEDRVINELSWELGNKRALNPYSFRLALEQQRYDDIFQPEIRRNYLRASFEMNANYTFEKGRNFSFRMFLGGFLKNEVKERGYSYPGAFNLTSQGFNDYRYDDFYFGRTEATGFFSQQILLQEGGMKIPLGSPYAEGRSRDFIFAINLKSDLPEDLPGKLPLKPYFDLGYYSDARTISSDLTREDQIWWQGGFALEFGKGIFGVYFPVVNSKNVKDLYNGSGRDSFLERISFSLDIAKLNPWKLVDEISF